ncbi:hypothetical protein [Tenacibaculum singaporense]|uniref:hypothetical protein n=1 Tax=Tenacibaculum singaporense TaxID=2358479 RepID=UPI003516505D
MEFEKVIELLNELTEAKENNELEWKSIRNTSYETNWNGEDIIIDRHNNVDKDSLEIYIRIGQFEAEYLSSTDEFSFLSNYIDSI